MKNKQLFILLLLSSTFIFGLYRCSVEKKTSLTVAPPFENINVKFTEYNISSTNEDTLHSASGSSIIIPKDAFIDENGQTYNGKLLVKYREFHNATDILASGITMTYDSAGQKQEFQTAGMFEITAHKPDNSALYLAPDKEVKINMASYVNGSKYNFYYLNEKSGWQYQGRNEAVLNETKQKLISLLPDSVYKPVKPNDLDPKEKVFNLSFDETTHPELKDFSDVVWQYAGIKGDSLRDPSLNAWVYKYAWQKADIGKYNNTEMNFELMLSAPGKKFNTIVKPVLTGNKLKRALKDFEEKLTNYNRVKEEKKNADQLIQQQGDFVRSFSIKNFGIYNWDCVLRQPNRMIISADFKFNGDIHIPQENLIIYLVTGSDRSLVKYAYEDRVNFSFDPNASNKLVVILPGNKIAVFTEEQFKLLDVEKIKFDKAYTFQLQINKAVIKDMEDLSKSING